MARDRKEDLQKMMFCQPILADKVGHAMLYSHHNPAGQSATLTLLYNIISYMMMMLA